MLYPYPRLLLTALLLLLVVGTGYSQTVTFAVAPANAFVRVNGEVLDLSEQTTLDLPAGTYEAEFWAPAFLVESKTITVVASGANVVRFGMKKLSPEFEDFRSEKSSYNTAILKRTLTDVSTVGGTLAVGYLTIALRGDQDSEEEIENALLQYQNSVDPVRIQEGADNYQRLADEYNSRQTRRDIGVGVGAALTAAGVFITYRYLTKWRKKPVKPVWQPDNPFVSTNRPVLTPAIGLSGRGGQAGFTLTF